MRLHCLMPLTIAVSIHSAFASVTLTSPQAGSAVTSPVQYVATAAAPTCSKGVASMGIFVNSTLVYKVSGNKINTALTMGTGSQHTVVQEWDKCGQASYATINLTVVNPTAPPTISLAANPSTFPAGSSSVLKVTAANATQVKVVGTNGASFTLAGTGGSIWIHPAVTTTYTATATGSGGTATASLLITIAYPVPTVSLIASPASIFSGGTTTLTASATNATQVSLTGTDGSSYVLGPSGGGQQVSPASSTIYTATASGAGGSTSSTTTVSVTGKALTSIALSPSPATFSMGSTQQFTATATYNDASSADVTSVVGWSTSNPAVATIDSNGVATAVASGTTSVTAILEQVNGTAAISVGIAPGTGVNVATWHMDTNRSGLNSGEASLTPANVGPASFGKLFSYSVDGYAYAEPLIVSNLEIGGTSRNVLFVATEKDSVYAFDADAFGTGNPLWKVSLLNAGETPSTAGPILPFEGVTSTPAIDLNTETLYVVSKQSISGKVTFRLSALDLTTGAQKFGGPVTIQASVPGTNATAVNGIVSLPTGCVQRAALLLAYGNVYIGFGSCHEGWLLAYDAQTLTQTGVFNVSPNMDGEGQYASAGGVWMGSGGPVADGTGNVYITTGNGPWDGSSAFADSILKLSSTLNLEDYFTPAESEYMNCRDSDLAAGGLMLLPGTSQLLAGGKMGKLYLVDSNNMGHQQDADAGATQTLWFEPDLSPPYPSTCTDASGTHSAPATSYEIFGTSAYFNNAVYLGITPTSVYAHAGVRRFTYSGTLTPGSYTAASAQQYTRGTTPFLSSDGNANGILWIVDQGLPVQSTGAGAPTTAALRAFDPTDLSIELYDSAANPSDTPGYGIKFSSPVVANGKVYISSGHDNYTVPNPLGEIDVYGLH